VTIYRSPAGLDDLRVVGVSLAHPDTAAAEHWLVSLPERPVLACTHLVQSPSPHVALSLAFASAASAASPLETASALGAAPASEGAATAAFAAAGAAAAAAHEGRQSGRAVIYPGVDVLVGTLSVGEILAVSAITRVEVLGSETADPATLVETGDFVRPQWRAGELVLTTTPAAGDRLVPFETRNPTPCCAAH
jgi:hypothetical protein